jgi:hypothetical protein
MNIKTLAYGCLGLQELKQHKPWFDEECLGFLNQWKQAKMQRVQDPIQSNVGSLTMLDMEPADISGTKRGNM